MLKRLSPLDLSLAVFILMYYGRLSVVLFVPQYAIDNGIPAPSGETLNIQTVNRSGEPENRRVTETEN